MRRTIFQAGLLALVLLVTLPPLALLCRGRSPSRFAAGNLPNWEHQLPHPASLRVPLRALPLAPGAVRLNDQSLRSTLMHLNENQLLAAMESPSGHTTLKAGAAGQWLEMACASGRTDRVLAAKQDRIALRLMNTQANDGYLAAGSGRARWSAAQVTTYSRNLRGLLAYYALTHNPAAIYAAMRAGDLLLSTPGLRIHGKRPAFHSRKRLPQGRPFVPKHPLPLRPFRPVGRKQAASSKNKGLATALPTLVLPMTRLYLLTDDVRYRRWAQQTAHAGRADGVGWAALYLATGQRSCLYQAQEAWKRGAAHGHKSPDLAAALLVITGAPGYAAALRSVPAPWSCPLLPGTLAWTHAGRRVTLNTWSSSQITWQGAQVTEEIFKTAGARPRIILTVRTPRPAQWTLFLPLPAAGIKMSVNGRLAGPRPGQQWITLARLWKNGDQVRLLPAVLPSPPPAAIARLPRFHSGMSNGGGFWRRHL